MDERDYKAMNKELNKPSCLGAVSGSLPIAELEEFFYEMGEDWHLWDKEEQGQYPVQRIFDAVKKFIAEKKLSNDR